MKKALFEKRKFNDYAEAQDLVARAKRKQYRLFIGLAISLIASVFGVMSFTRSTVEYAIYAVLLAIPAYIIGGGFGSALKMARNLAIFGWIIIPFPLDLVTGLTTLIVALLGFFMVPVLFVFLNFVKHNKDYAEARRYLGYFSKEEA